MKALLTLAIISLAIPAQAQLVVFKNKITVALTGGGFTSRQTVTGWTILDLQTKQLARFDVFPTVKQYRVSELTDWQVATATGPGREYLLFTQATSTAGKMDSAMIKGQNALTEIHRPAAGPPVARMVPKTMTVYARSLYPLANGNQIEETSGSLTLDSKLTKDANFYQWGTAALIANLRLDFLDLDWTEAP